ncbi:MAG: type II and III secretion system protein [Acidobacteria bacterium]|nr:type II and III secretion system protein [Acidobacteriota bacterium]
MALATKLIRDLDKAKAEVVVDVVVMELSKTKTRDLVSGISTGSASGLNIPVTFSPRNPITTDSDSSISLSQLGRLSTGDFAVTLPGAQLKAVLTNGDGRVLQAPQVRSIEMQKASLRIGDKIPFATGSYSTGATTASVSPLVSTQFQFAEVGVNVDLTPKVHQDEISLHIEMELSTVRERIDIGGLQQPVIGQRKLIHDIRLREGEVSLLGGLQGLTDSKTTGGIPGVSQIPILRRLFSNESTNRTETELVIFLVPHIVRGPDLTPTNTRGIAAGTDTNVKLSYGAGETNRR